MSSLLIPISLFVRTFTYAVPVTTAGLPFVLYLLIVGVGLYRNDLSAMLADPLITKKGLFFVLLALATQCVAMFLSFQRFGTSTQNAGLIHGILDIFLVVLSIVLAWFAVKVLILTDQDILRFMRGLIVGLFVYSLLVLLPQIIATIGPYMHDWVNFVAGLFEKHWYQRDWYDLGSYAVTMHRVNGFEAEAGYLAALIGCVFLPPIIAALVNHYDFFTNDQHHHRWIYIGLLVWLLIVLALARTSTGFLVIGLALIALFWKSDTGHKVFYYLLAIVVSVLIVLAFENVDAFQTLLNQYIFQKGGTDNRLGGTIGLLITFLHHPIIGVGNNWTGNYLMEFVPRATRNNPEYLFVYMKQQYPALSNWGAWLAQYGLIVVGPILYYIWKRVRLGIKLKPQLRASTVPNKSLYLTIIDAFEIFLWMYLILSILVFSWNDYYMTISFFFYVAVITMANKAVQKEQSV